MLLWQKCLLFQGTNSYTRISLKDLLSILALEGMRLSCSHFKSHLPKVCESGICSYYQARQKLTSACVEWWLVPSTRTPNGTQVSLHTETSAAVERMGIRNVSFYYTVSTCQLGCVALKLVDVLNLDNLVQNSTFVQNPGLFFQNIYFYSQMYVYLSQSRF